MNKILLTGFLIMLCISSSAGVSLAADFDDSYYDNSTRSVICKEPLPTFTLSEESNPTDRDVARLCTCIWQSFPDDGWEQKTSHKIRVGEDPGWQGRALVSRFGAALADCGGYDL